MSAPHLDHQLPDSDADGVRRVLARYSIDVRACVMDPTAAVRGYSGALVWQVGTGETVYCLRRWPTSGLSQQRLVELHRFLRHLGESGIDQIAVPLRDSTGQTLIEADGHLWQLEPWKPGTADFHHAPTESRLRSAMQTLARLHLAADAYVCPQSGRAWFDRHPSAPSPACRERLARLHSWSPSRLCETKERLAASAPAVFSRVAMNVLALFQAASRPVELELLLIQDLAFRLHPCLRDVWHDHLLFTGDDLTGLVDPSAARMENVASDLSRLLGSLLGDDSARWDTGLSEYSKVRPLSAGERELTAALDRSGVLLSGMTWIDRFIDGRLDGHDVPRITARLETIRDRLANLVRTL